MSNNLKAMEEIKQSLKRICAAKLQLVNDIIQKIESEKTSAANNLEDGMAQVQLSSDQNHLMSKDSGSGDLSNDQNEHATNNQQAATSSEAVDKQIIEKFRLDGNLTFDSQQIIVNVFNQFLGPKNIRILRDDAHGTWVCLQYLTKSRSYQIKFYSPLSDTNWSDFPIAREKFVNEINAWLPNIRDQNPFAKFEFPSCSKSNSPVTRFVYVLMFAFGCHLNVEESFLNPPGDQAVENVRKIICDALTNGLEKEMPTIQAIWNTSSANQK